MVACAGYGDPLERDAAAVLADVLDGKVSEPQLGQKPRPLQENGTSRSRAQSLHRRRAKPCASTPQVRKFSELLLYEFGQREAVGISPRRLQERLADNAEFARSACRHRDRWRGDREMISAIGVASAVTVPAGERSTRRERGSTDAWAPDRLRRDPTAGR
jgi:hypothetical protein